MPIQGIDLLTVQKHGVALGAPHILLQDSALATADDFFPGLEVYLQLGPGAGEKPSTLFC